MEYGASEGRLNKDLWADIHVPHVGFSFPAEGQEGTFDKERMGPGIRDFITSLFQFLQLWGKGASLRYGFLLQADIEIAQAQEAAEASSQAEARRAQAGSDEDDDVAVFKARSMDEWKDDHPSGYGNSKLRPTA